MYSFGYETYSYPRSLTLRRIRLIKLLPPTRSAWPPFRLIPRVKLIEYDLDPLEDPIPPFEALSYTWNTRPREKPSWPILVETAAGDLQELLIYKNLFLALQSLWNSQLTTLPIFADQICINQHDIPERNFHVALMGELYSRCARVIVWLGPATTRSDTLFDFARTIGGEASVVALLSIPPQERLRLMDAIVDRTCSEDDELFNVVTRFEPEFPVAGYAEVLKRGWFTRLWIIQEASLAPDGLLFCGEKSFTFDDFRALFFFHSVSSRVWSSRRSKAISVAELRLRDSIFQLERPFVRIFGERMAIHRTNQRRPLYELVKKYNVNEDDSKMGTTEPEDRIFGLLGLAELDGPAPATDIGNPKGVYTEFAAEIIRKDPDILCFARGVKNLSLPSWVPDWSMSQLKIPYGYTTLTSEPIYKAGGGLSDNCPTVSTEGTLNTSAVIVGKILEIGQYEIKLEDEPLTINNFDFSSLKEFFGEIDAFLEKASTISGTYNHYARDEGARLQASLDLTDGGLTARQFPDSDSDYPPLKEMYDELRRFSDRLVRDQETTATYTSVTRTFNKHRPQPGPWVRAFPVLSIFQLISSVFEATLAVARFRLYLKMVPIRRRLAGVPAIAPNATDPHGIVDMELHRNTKMFEYKANIFRHHGRKLYLTDGGLVGLGPTDLARGDVVVIIPGGSVPHIVRPSMSSAAQGPDVGLGKTGSADQVLNCTYVGEAYCHGAMDGELMASGVKERILRIS
ncbi:hypothetical protein Hte_011940 [Hypoxylon texense]